MDGGFTHWGRGFCATHFDVPAGHLLDRLGYRRLLGWTTLFFFLAGFVFLFGFHTETYILSLLAATIGWLFFGPGVDAYILSQASSSNAGRFMAFRDSFESLGGILTTAVLGFILLFSIKHIAFLIAIPMLVAFFLIRLSPKDTHPAQTEKKISSHHFHFRRHPFKSSMRQ